MTTTPRSLSPAVSSATTDAVLRRAAARFPHRVALTFADRRWTYAALDTAVDRVATMLAGQGL
ncbi:MAG: acyl-CoA synthetase, partial [Dietzia sp.]